MDDQKKICITLLKLFKVADKAEPQDLQNFKSHKSQNYALGPVYSFDYKDKHYYVVDDYSLGDDEEYVKNILLDINHTLKGNIVRSPAQNSEYCIELNTNQYYLWESPLL